MNPSRRRVIGVLGSGTAADASAAEVGRLVALLGCDLLTGGGGGVMEAASRAFTATPGRKGICIGIIPGMVERMTDLETRAPGSECVRLQTDPRYPNACVELAIVTHLPDSGEAGTRRSSRNHINVLSSHALVALPGGAGTESRNVAGTAIRRPADRVRRACVVARRRPPRTRPRGARGVSAVPRSGFRSLILCSVSVFCVLSSVFCLLYSVFCHPPPMPQLRIEPSFAAWQTAARKLLQAHVHPDAVEWIEDVRGDSAKGLFEASSAD